MNAMGSQVKTLATTLLITGGDFYFPGPVYMTQPGIIRGDGGSINSASRLLFPFNGAGIVASRETEPNAPGNALRGKIEHLDIVNEGPASIVQRRLGWLYIAGSTVVSPGNGTVAFRCMTSGRAVDPPSRFDAANVGDTIVESNGTRWLAIAKVPLSVSVWQPGHRYNLGDIVISSGFNKGSIHYGDNRFTYVCSVPGTSGPKDPFGPQAFDDDVIEEPAGSPTWRVNVWSAIVMQSSITIDHVTTFRWTNSAIHVYADASKKSHTKNSATNFTITNLMSNNDGMGIYVAGDDANGGFIAFCKISGTGSFTPGAGGHAFWDHCQSQTTWLGNYAQEITGAGCINQTTGKSTWINNYVEGSRAPSVVLFGAAISVATSWHPTLYQQVTNFDLSEGRAFVTTDHTCAVTTVTQRGFFGYIDSFHTTDDMGNQFVRQYNAHPWLRGWYTDEMIGLNGALIGGVSGRQAAEGPGHCWTAAGAFTGPHNQKRYFGFDPLMWESNRLREGKRLPGDIFLGDPPAGPGDWLGKVVTVAGTSGVQWMPNEKFTQKQVGLETTHRYNLPADIVTPGDGFAYACTKSGTSGDKLPPFAASTVTGPNAPIWTGSVGYWPGSVVRPSVANGVFYHLVQYPAWTRKTKIKPNQIITTGDSNGNLFFAYVERWSAGAVHGLGDMVQPFPPDDRVFKVAGLKVAAAAYGKTGDTQPTWSDTSPVDDGTLVWQIDHLVTGDLDPPGDSIDVVGWNTETGGDTYDNNIVWRCFVPTSGTIEPKWNPVLGSITVDTPGATVGPKGSVDPGFGVLWVAAGADPPEAKVADGTCEWTRIDVEPRTAKIFQVGPADGPKAAGLTVSLAPATRTETNDAAGKWQIEGGAVQANGVGIGEYAVTRRVVNGGITLQKMAMLTLTIFFTKPAGESVTLQGYHDLTSGEESGSVSAASAGLSSYIGKQFKRTGNTLAIQP